jgi:integrase
MNGSQDGSVHPIGKSPICSKLHTWIDLFEPMHKKFGRPPGYAFSVHTHMLGHDCGYALASEGHDTRATQDWLGHRSIQHTVR